MLTPEQLKERLGYIGASDAPGILGMSRWSTPLEIWGLKTQNLPPKDLSDHFPVILGNRLEEVVAELFSAKTGKKVRRVNETFYHPKHKFLACNIDRKIVGEETIVECKTASAWKKNEWAGEEVPIEYVLQVQQMLSVTGYKKAWLAVLIGNTDFLVKEVVRDDSLIESMTTRLVHFWETFVVTKTIPMNTTANDADVLSQLFPLPKPGSETEFDDEMDQLIENRNSLYADSKSVEALLKKVENDIKLRMGDFEIGKTPNNTVSWKAQSRTSLDAKLLEEEMPDVYAKYKKESDFRVLRIKGNKEETKK